MLEVGMPVKYRGRHFVVDSIDRVYDRVTLRDDEGETFTVRAYMVTPA